MNFKVELVALVFKLIDQKLCLLLRQPEGRHSPTWSLPVSLLGRSKAPEENLKECIHGLGFTGSYFEQLYTFADEKNGVIRMAYVVFTTPSELESPDLNSGTVWAHVNRVPKLREVHAGIKELGMQRLRNKVSYSRIATWLLPEEFTLTELMNVYEEILNEAMDKRNFRKKVELKKLVVPTANYRHGVHRPARLYRQGPKARNVPL